MEVDGFCFQETLLQNGFAKTKIQNTIDKTISIILDHRRKAFRFSEEHKRNLEFYHDEFITTTFN